MKRFNVHFRSNVVIERLSGVSPRLRGYLIERAIQEYIKSGLFDIESELGIWELSKRIVASDIGSGVVVNDRVNGSGSDGDSVEDVVNEDVISEDERVDVGGVFDDFFNE